MARELELASISTAELRRELAIRQVQLKPLIRRRKTTLQHIMRLDRHLHALGHVEFFVMRDGRRRSKNRFSLVKMLQQVLREKVMTAPDAADAVRQAGYGSTSVMFAHVVSVRLANSGKFRRVGRARYTAK